MPRCRNDQGRHCTPTVPGPSRSAPPGRCNPSARANRASLVALVGSIPLLAILSAQVALGAQAPATTPPIKHIVFLFSDESTIPGNVLTDGGLRAGFAKDPSFRTEYYHEYLDLTRFGDQAYQERLAGVLSQKFGGRQPDLIVTVSTPATLFAAKWGPIVFPGVPIVYAGVTSPALSALGSGFDATGVVAEFDIRGTVETALRLRPQTRRVVIVGGAAHLDQGFLELARADLAGLERQVSVEYLAGLRMSELLDRVARLPDDTFIFYVSIFRDAEGQDFQPPDAVEKLAARSSVPIFGASMSYLGYGIVGGHLFNWEKAGVLAAGLALRVLHGANPRDVPPPSGDLNSWMFDARQLKRWGIRERALPLGSVVQFRQPSLWREHPWSVVGAVLFFLFETALIVGLVAQRRQRRHAEEQQRLLSAIVESSNDAVIGIDKDQRIVAWNQGAQKVFGYTAEEAIGRGAEILVPPHLLQEGVSAFEHTMAGRTVAPFETVRLRKDGSSVDVSINDSPIHDHKGRIIGISSTQRDITETMQTQRSLNEREEHLRLATATGNLAPWVWYINKDALVATESGLRLYGLRSGVKLGLETMLATVDPEDREATRDGLRRVLKEREGYLMEYRVVWPTGETRWISMSARCQYDGDGKPKRVMGVSLDITERKRAELERQQLQNELSHVARVTMMGELTSSLAHELNQPLTAILSNAQTAQRMLAAGIPDLEELGEILNDIVADDERAGGVIGRLRTLLKNEQPELQPVNLNNLVVEVAGLVRSDAIIKNVSLTLDLIPDLPPIRGDRVQLQQVLLNLMMNALDAMKGTAGRDRRLVARTECGEGIARVAVRDSGTGIPAYQLEHIFEPFFTTKPEGLGMGLAIARSIIRSHGGRLWAENNPGGGATFTLALPIVQ
jgi:PAS domain S-box-containing protein